MKLLFLGAVLIILCVLATLVVVYLFRSLKKQLEIRESELRVVFIRCKEVHQGAQKRVSIVSSHASEYVNSLKGETSKKLLLLQRLIAAPEKLLSEAEFILSSRDYKRLSELERLLTALVVAQSNPAYGGPPEGIDPSAPEIVEILQHYSLPADWSVQIEDLIQKIGKEIFEASQAVESLRAPTLRKRRETLQDLRSVGIVVASLEKDEDDK